MTDEVNLLLPDIWRFAIAIAVGCLAIIAARYTTMAQKRPRLRRPMETQVQHPNKRPGKKTLAATMGARLRRPRSSRSRPCRRECRSSHTTIASRTTFGRCASAKRTLTSRANTAECKSMLGDGRAGYASEVRDITPGFDSLTDARKVAVVDLAYNIGVPNYHGSTLRKRFIARDFPGACSEFIAATLPHYRNHRHRDRWRGAAHGRQRKALDRTDRACARQRNERAEAQGGFGRSSQRGARGDLKTERRGDADRGARPRSLTRRRPLMMPTMRKIALLSLMALADCVSQSPTSSPQAVATPQIQV
jgi:GH24 family phage-related lysozyme (muramidase)